VGGGWAVLGVGELCGSSFACALECVVVAAEGLQVVGVVVVAAVDVVDVGGWGLAADAVGVPLALVVGCVEGGGSDGGPVGGELVTSGAGGPCHVVQPPREWESPPVPGGTAGC
jgi:hypothetical protein